MHGGGCGMTPLIEYAIRDKTTKKYLRVPKNDVTGETYEWVRGINKAQTYVQNDDGGWRTAQYVICKFKISNCEIVACYDLENYKMGRLYNREVKGTVWSN
jgi:hypothetical protein